MKQVKRKNIKKICVNTATVHVCAYGNTVTGAAHILESVISILYTYIGLLSALPYLAIHKYHTVGP